MGPQRPGTTGFQAPDPATRPYIDVNHLSAAIDRSSAISLFRWIRKLAAQPALAPWLVAATTPGTEIQSDEQIIDAFLQSGNTAYHVCGTVRMGGDSTAPLDPQLRVRGVENVRVADTSIMPTITSGNTNAPAMVLGMRAADLILASRTADARAA